MSDLKKHYSEIYEYIDSIKIIDTHEHLPDESSRIAREVDFSIMFSHYCREDLLSSGMTRDELNSFLVLSMERIYGIKSLDSPQEAEELTERIKKNNTPGLYKRIIDQTCRISHVVNYEQGSGDNFKKVELYYPYMEIAKIDHIRDIEARFGKLGIKRQITSLETYIKALGEHISYLVKSGVIGLKFPNAYMRDLDFAPVTASEAEVLFNRIFSEAQGNSRHSGLGYEESIPLQNHIFHLIMDIVAETDLLVVFHTGYQACNFNKLDNARPERLWSLFRRYPGIRFVLLHAGFPWIREAGLLAKQYPNVYLDLAWLHILSRSTAQEAVRFFIDTVPMNKISGFGGDYSVVEKIYGHLVIAKQNISEALARMLDAGRLDMKGACLWAKGMLFDNPYNLYISRKGDPYEKDRDTGKEDGM